MKPFRDMQERSDRRSLAIHRAVVRHLKADPALWDVSFQNLKRWGEREGGLNPPQKVWLGILENHTRDEVLRILVSRSQLATLLRSSSPFVGIITKEERTRIFERYAWPGPQSGGDEQ